MKTPSFTTSFLITVSYYRGKRFDLGSYEAGTTRQVRFDRVGISYILCNIHKQMSAVVIALNTPYFGVRNKDGSVHIRSVPFGHYMMHVWAEGTEAEEVADLQREITIDGVSHFLGTMSVSATSLSASDHKNKYGQDYPATAINPVYPQ